MNNLKFKFLRKQHKFEVFSFLNNTLLQKINTLLRNNIFMLFLTEFDHRKMSSEDLSIRLTSIHKSCLNQLLAILQSLNSRVQSFSLNFPNESINDDDLQVISSYLYKLKYLKSLDLNLFNNCIGIQGISKLALAIGSLQSLKTLSLSLGYNNVPFDGIINITQNLISNSKLSSLKLNLFNLEIKDKGLNSIIDCCWLLKNMIHLDLNLYNNKISYEGIYSLIEFLKYNTNLRFLILKRI